MWANRADSRVLCWQKQAREPSRISLLRRSSEKNAGCPMSKLLAILATLKATLIAASVAFARGDMLPVILISILVNLTQLGAKPIAGAARPCSESAAPRSQPLTSHGRYQVLGDGYGTTADAPT